MATSTDLQAAIEEMRLLMCPEREKLAKPTIEEALRLTKEDWAKRFAERLGSVPWWMISTLIHGALLLLASLLGLCVAEPQAEVQRTIIIPDFPVRPEVEYRRRKRPDLEPEREFFRKVDEEGFLPVACEDPRSEVREMNAAEPDEEPAFGRPEAIGGIPLGEEGVSRTMAPLSLNAGDYFDGRFAESFGDQRSKGRGYLARRGGGGPRTENAVELALAWLARHQEADGRWDSRKWDLTETSRPARATDTADTGLALLAFLGAGYTPKHGRYKDSTARAIRWIISRQKPDGALYAKKGGHRESAGYQHAICGLALAEAFGMTGNERVRRAAQRAVDYSINVHQKPYSGWRYDPGSGADLSVTGWFMMQLKSAKMAGLRLDGRGFQGAANFLDKVTDGTGRCGYTSARSVSPTMTSVGMLCRQFLGALPGDPLVRGGAAYLLEHPPVGGKRAHPKSFYYWYYGTLTMFQVGGPGWRRWNAAMKKNLLESQRTEGDARGSWDPVGRYDRIAGRVYTTAMGALTLEVYYRYLQLHPR